MPSKTAPREQELAPKKKGSWILRKLRRRPSEPDIASANNGAVNPRPAKGQKGNSSKQQEKLKAAQPLPANSGRHTPTSAAIGTLGASTAADGLASTLRIPGKGQSTSPAPRLAALPQMDSISSAEVVASSNVAAPPMAHAPAPMITSRPGTGAGSTVLQTPHSRTDSLIGGAPSSLATGAQAENDIGLTSTSGTVVSDTPELATTSGDTAEERDGDFSRASTEAHAQAQRDENGELRDLGRDMSRSSYGMTEDDDVSSRNPRDSTDAATMDTGKSRASTKPTTLMSVDATGPNGPAHIAQAANPGSSHSPSSPGIHFAAASTSSNGTHAGPRLQQTSSTEHEHSTDDAGANMPYVNVPGHSRPHPYNNPTPTGFPADNASMLTLASSNAAHSLAGAPSHRSIAGGLGGYAPSLGGAKSIVGSLIGDRRNSSDTHASMKALPPLSRRGSESSTRTGAESVAPSHTGSHAAPSFISQAPSGQVVPAATGPGAPPERISIHRTPSQRTVATQFSIPLSTHAPAGSDTALPVSTNA